MEPVHITVAEAVIESGHVRMEDLLPETITLKPGQDLQLDFVYRFHEAEGDREEFMIRMRSSLGDDRAPEASHRLRDRPILQDEEWGRIRQVYTNAELGSHQLMVDCEAKYGSRPWRGKGGESLERSESVHEVTVVVSDA